MFKLIVFIFVIAFAFCMRETSLINDPNIINQINAIPKLWIAGKNSFFDGLTYKDARKYLGARRSRINYPTKTYSKTNLPEEFDWRKEKPECVHAIRDQKSCGSCYAFGASEAVSDRFCIFSKGEINEVMSPQWIVSCDKQEWGCSGGWPNKVFDFLSTTGIVTDKCMPYTSGGGSVEACPTKCKDGSDLKMYKINNASTVIGADNFMNELIRGPFEVCMAVYQDFFNYKSGVYHHVSGGLAGYHAIKILGWGVDSTSKTPYWIVANSWGEGWGIKGIFLIKKGTDECEMESGVKGQLPAVTGDPIVN